MLAIVRNRAPARRLRKSGAVRFDFQLQNPNGALVLGHAKLKSVPRGRLTPQMKGPFFVHVQSLPLDQGMVRYPAPLSQRAAPQFRVQSERRADRARPDPRGGGGVVLARFGINRLGSGDKPRPPLLNVRTDGMRKGQFRKHLKERRCVIPCEGFYEWRDEGGKQPYYFSRKDGKPMMLAGIWEIAEYKGDTRVAFAILTDQPNELVASYHDRMPLALADDKVETWLDLSNESPLDGNLLLYLDEFTVRPMDRAMNNVRQKNLAAIDPEAKAA
jgi:putative SOS response-associated peptidase YedK